MKATRMFCATLAAMGLGILPAPWASADEVAVLQQALADGKASLQLRLRGEHVDYDTTPETDAETLRTVLGYRTGAYHGVNAVLEFENVSALGNGDYNSGTSGFGNGKTQFGLIPDPALTQFNQYYLEGYGLRLGRQKIIYDNARFIGDVGWRQNDQTFDAASFSHTGGVQGLTVNAAWLTRVNNIFGVTRAVQAPLVNLRYAAWPQARLSLFHYAVEEETAPASSWQHSGARVDGTLAQFLYELSYARQSDYADATAAGTPDANYHDVQLGYRIGPVTVKLQQEVLEKGFKTPLATLHAFNGWADRFLATPADGLEDRALWVNAAVSGFGLVLAGHDFRAETGGGRYGREVDLSVSHALQPKLTLLLKAARFEAEGSVAGFGNDTGKAWLQVDYRM